MLYDISGKQQHQIPHHDDYQRWRALLSDLDHMAIIYHLHEMMDHEDVFNSSFIPGSDWTGTVFQPIYETACKKSWEQSRLFFGLLVWEAVMRHESDWCFLSRDSNESLGVLGKTYFRRS
jgi:hypothetical protein